MKALKKILVGIGAFVILCVIVGLVSPSKSAEADTTEEVSTETTKVVETTESETEMSFNPDDSVTYAELICTDSDHKLTLYNTGSNDSIGAHFESVNDANNTYDVLLYVDPEDVNSYWSEDKSINMWCGEDMIYRVINSSKDYWEFSAEYHLVDDDTYNENTDTTSSNEISGIEFSNEADEPSDGYWLDNNTDEIINYVEDANNIGTTAYINDAVVESVDPDNDAITVSVESDTTYLYIMLTNISSVTSKAYDVGDVVTFTAVYKDVFSSDTALFEPLDFGLSIDYE